MDPKQETEEKQLKSCVKHWEKLSDVRIETFAKVLVSDAEVLKLAQVKQLLAAHMQRPIDGLWASSAEDAISCIRGVSLGAVGTAWGKRKGTIRIKMTEEHKATADHHAFASLAALCGYNYQTVIRTDDLNHSHEMFQDRDFYIADNNMEPYKALSWEAAPWQIVCACVRPDQKTVAVFCVNLLPWLNDS